ncbi:MAG: NADH-ubiquinone dehydrogenase [Aquamicrobium sp.]|uniref:NADH-ubiquinone dehydrogenase n=1 Tax=Aquamicrobium sp. TaxID=1872579 RepID=UPI00349E9E83|nr:NADH-ubiquinone dehydrogenase [Aquamicrobium sp.]
MSTIDDFTKVYMDAMPEQLAGTVNLMAHPLAGMAAASALGLGLAGQAFGMWAGAVAGAAEASQKLFAGLAEQEAQRRQPPARLRLVASGPAPCKEPAAPRGNARKAPVKAVEAAGTAASTQPAAIERPARPDDLKAISGVGPKLEKTLNGLGIWTYAQIAALNAAEIAWLDEKLGFAGRIGRDDWIGQAGRLSAGS